MKRIITALTVILAIAACKGPAFDPATVADATAEQVTRVEPLSWWTGMKMPLQLLVQGDNISEYSVAVEGGAGVSVEKVTKADSPNFLFVDVKIAANAKPGTYYVVPWRRAWKPTPVSLPGESHGQRSLAGSGR